MISPSNPHPALNGTDPLAEAERSLRQAQEALEALQRTEEALALLADPVRKVRHFLELDLEIGAAVLRHLEDGEIRALPHRFLIEMLFHDDRQVREAAQVILGRWRRPEPKLKIEYARIRR